jgi:hypothetical protein
MNLQLPAVLFRSFQPGCSTVSTFAANRARFSGFTRLTAAA